MRCAEFGGRSVFLRRIFNLPRYEDFSPPISSVNLKYPNKEVIQRLDSQSRSSTDFRRALDHNLEAIAKMLDGRKVTYSFEPWSGHPPFHGVALGDNILRGHWKVNKHNAINIHTHAVYYTRQSNPEIWSETISAFLASRGAR